MTTITSRTIKEHRVKGITTKVDSRTIRLRGDRAAVFSRNWEIREISNSLDDLRLEQPEEGALIRINESNKREGHRSQSGNSRITTNSSKRSTTRRTTGTGMITLLEARLSKEEVICSAEDLECRMLTELEIMSTELPTNRGDFQWGLVSNLKV